MSNRAAGSKSARPAHAFADIVASPEFVSAWRAAVESPLSFDELRTFAMPDGLTPDELWDALCTLRRHAGVTCAVLPWTQVDVDVSWYYIPKAVHDDIALLNALGSDSSFLGSYLQRNKRSDFDILKPVFREVVSLARRDGMELTTGQVGRIWLGAKQPESDVERVIKNLAGLFYSLDRQKDRRLSLMMVDDIHEMLTAGVGELGLQRRRMLQAELYWTERVDSPAFAQEMLENVVELARSDRRFRSPVLIGVEITDVFWDLPVFPELNALTEFLVRRAFFLQHGLGVLSYVPYSATREELGNGYIKAYQEGYLGSGRDVKTVEGLDTSLLYIGAVKTYLSGVQELEAKMRRASERDQNVRRKLEDVEGLNERQRSFVAMAASRPGYAFSIKDYEGAFGVVYSTARADLTELADRGVLICKKKSRSFTFSINPAALKDVTPTAGLM